MIKKTMNIIGIVVTGLTMAAALYLGYNEIDDRLYLSSPIENIFEVQKVIVPDFIYGEDPPIVYDRQIKRSFIGDFVVELKSPSQDKAICFGGGTGFKYAAGEQHKDDITLAWYLNTRDLYTTCRDITPGQYYLETNYTIHIEGFPDRHLTNLSNVFEILTPK